MKKVLIALAVAYCWGHWQGFGAGQKYEQEMAQVREQQMTVEMKGMGLID